MTCVFQCVHACAMCTSNVCMHAQGTCEASMQNHDARHVIIAKAHIDQIICSHS